MNVIIALLFIDSLSELWVWQLMGRLHPIIVHFPIGVLVVAFFLELFTLGNKRSELRAGIRWLVYIGAGTSLVAVLFGLMLAYGSNYSESTLNLHRWTGIATAVAALSAAGLLYRADLSRRKKDLNIYRSILGLTVLLLTFAGHFGASLTHGEGFISDVLPWNHEVVSEGEFTELLTEVKEHSEMGSVAPQHLNELNVGVRRIFANSCYRCHASDEMEGGLALDSEAAVMAGGDGGPIITPGEPESSELMKRLLLPAGHDDVMPQKGRALFPDEIELIQTWIELGAHWSDEEVLTFREAEMALSKPELPHSGNEFENPVDRFVDIYFKEQGISWQEPVNDTLFVRRVYLDVIGLLPEPGELKEFLSDTSANKRDQLIESLLNREHDYAQHSLSFWNDLLRNAYTGTGFITGGRKQITEWLYDALENNKPYNQMVSELLSPGEKSEGFIRGIQWRGDVNASQTTEMQAAQNLSQSLMGVNLKCASCHNSFVSNWTLKDAYSLAAVFSDTSLAIERCEEPTGDFAEPGFLYSELGEVDKNLPTDDRLEQLADIVTQEENGRLYRTITNRHWQRLMGKGLVEPVDEMDTKPWNQELLDWLAADFIDHNYNQKYLLSLILRSRTYQLPTVGLSAEEARAPSDEYVFKGPLRKRLTAEQFADALTRLAVPVYSSVAYDPFDTRIAEASWIWFDARENGRPAFAPPGQYYLRHTFDLSNDKIINEARLLISADERFELIINGESTVGGHDWREVQNVDVTDYLTTGKNLLAVKAEKRGATAEPAGVLLNMEITYSDGTKSEVRSNTDWKINNQDPDPDWALSDFDDSDWYSVRSFGSSLDNKYWGRLLDFSHESTEDRLQFVRASLVENDDFQKALGRPPREIVITKRDSEPTLLQALELTNGEMVNDVLSRGADRWIREYGEDPEELIRQIYLRALSRPPTGQEARIIGKLLGQKPNNEAVQDLLWAVTMKPEFQMIY
ncbi:DUF1549 domain-containing protein [Rhodohalobacter sulfatireducens]|uniref:DUF1549 domain-containing protein n=1 Tax=Rhodohalobacter sulfatireducens TaxID=2911366 RepID=UPI001EDAB03A